VTFASSAFHAWTFVVGAFCVFSSCADDYIAPNFTATAQTTTTSSSGVPTTTELEPTTTSPTTTTGDPLPSGCVQDYPLSLMLFALHSDKPAAEMVIPARHCDMLNLVGTGAHQLDPIEDLFTVYTYRPQAGMGEWPNFRLPYVVFSPGAGQYSVDFDPINPMDPTAQYLPLIQAFTSVGFVVFAIQPPESDRGRNWTVGRRTRAMACTAIWAFTDGGWSQSGEGRLNCDFVLAGHSRGGEAAHHFAANIVGALNGSGIEDQILRGVVALAPRSKTIAEAAGLPVSDEGTTPIAGDESIPYLILHGANDEDTTNGPTRSFEINGHEESALLPRHDKFLLWAHDISHNRWGGTSATIDAKVAGIISHYVPAFLRWQILENNDSSDRQRFMDLLHFDRNAVTLDPSLDGMTFWANTSPEYADLDSPVIFGDFAPGLKGDPDKRLQIDNMLRAVPGCTAPSVMPASSGETVTTLGFSVGQVCMGSSEDLTTPIPINVPDTWHRETSAMRVRWGGLEFGGSIEWSVDRDLSEYSFLSLRAGNINHASPHTMTTISIGLKTPSGMVSQTFPVDVDLYTQDDFSVASTSQTVNFMRSIRIPLSAFCDQGADIADVEAVIITFDNDVDSRAVLLDSIEFTKADDEMDIGQCI
jgi:hypothetical protein